MIERERRSREREERNRIAEQNRKEEEKIRAKKERLAQALSKMRKKYDSMEQTTWYYPKTAPEYTNSDAFYLYIEKKDKGRPLLRWRISYVARLMQNTKMTRAKDLVHVKKFIISYGDERYRNPDVRFKRGSNSRTNKWEWYDEIPSAAEIKMLRNLANAKKYAKIRLYGAVRNKDLGISQAALRDAFDAYEALGGE